MKPGFPLAVALFLAALPPVADAAPVYFNDFDGGPVVAPGVTAALTGVTTTEPVQGYAGLGLVGDTFGGRFLRNDTGWPVPGGPFGFPGQPTVLTLTNLPSHTSITLGFLLAIIDSWDGASSLIGGQLAVGDFLNVEVDGALVFREAFDTFDPADGYAAPPGGLLANTQLGFNLGHPRDSAYRLSFDIPHTAATLTIRWFADGPGWQGTTDESWAMDNIRLTLNGTAIPEPSTLATLLALGAGLAVVRRSRR